MSLALTDFGSVVRDELRWTLDRAKAAVVRPISRWVEEELILPSGPYKGERYRHRRHPASRLWFDALDSGKWNRHAASGPTQNGKTLMCYVAPVMYHLFELQETVIIGLPTMQMAADKWTEDLLPAIEASRFRDLLPTTGEGSKGGMVKRAIRFRNDVTLRFMTSGGGDKQRAGYTARVLAVTETDGMDEASETSREADKIEQLEGRTRAYGASKRIYLECTASIERGRIWQEIINGTDSRIYRPCPQCGQYVSPERDHLIGWQDAESELEAAEKSAFYCPSCGVLWSEDERRVAASHGVLVHKGQQVLPTGDVIGDLPKTKTLGFRWSAVDNPFTTAADLGAEEWKAARDSFSDNAEKKMRQFVWCLPWVPPSLDDIQLDWSAIKDRSDRLLKGIVPPETCAMTVGVDIGKRLAHWVAVAWMTNKFCHVLDYGRFDIAFDELGAERALTAALRDFRDLCESGWGGQGDRVVPDAVWIDSAYTTETVRSFVRESGPRYLPTIGRGTGQYAGQYAKPKSSGKVVREIGEEYHIEWVDRDQCHVVIINADHWKEFVHRRMLTPVGKPGAMTLFDSQGDKNCHTRFAKHMVSERQVEEFVVGKGRVTKWVAEHSNNHWFDAMYLASAAGHFAGWSLMAEQSPAASVSMPTDTRPSFATPDGRAFVALER